MGRRLLRIQTRKVDFGAGKDCTYTILHVHTIWDRAKSLLRQGHESETDEDGGN